MKIGSNEFSSIVRRIVREELKISLSDMIKEQLTENYIKRIVAESSKKGLSEYLEPSDVTDEEDIPKPKKNIDKGVYGPGSNKVRQEEKRNLPKLPGGLENLIFEGTKPIQPEGSAPENEMTSALAENLDYSALMDNLEKEQASRAPVQQSLDVKMRELEMRRKALDVPARPFSK